jgi:hypothetical protein
MGFAMLNPSYELFHWESRSGSVGHHQSVGWVERSDTHHVAVGALPRRVHRRFRSAAVMGFAALYPSYTLSFAQWREEFSEVYLYRGL